MGGGCCWPKNSTLLFLFLVVPRFRRGVPPSLPPSSATFLKAEIFFCSSIAFAITRGMAARLLQRDCFERMRTIARRSISANSKMELSFRSASAGGAYELIRARVLSAGGFPNFSTVPEPEMDGAMYGTLGNERTRQKRALRSAKLRTKMAKKLGLVPAS